MRSAPAIAFEYRPSRVLRRSCLVIATLALVAVGLSALAWWIRALLAGLVLLASWRAWPGLVQPTVVAAGWSTDDTWTLHLASADDVPALLLSFRVLGPFVLLRLQSPALGVQTLLLGADNSDADLRRRLRMRLATLQVGEALPRI